MHPSKIIFSLMVSLSAHAAIVLDANYTPTTVPASSGGLIVRSDLSDAQTFTVLNSGILESVDLDLFLPSFVTPSQSLNVKIVTTSGGIPSEATSGPTVLATATLMASALTTTPAFIPVSLAGFNVTAGEELAIVLTSNDPNGYYWDGDLDWPQEDLNIGTYPGGMAYDQGGSATIPNGNSYILGSSTWVPVFLYNSPGIESGQVADFGFQAYVQTTATPEPGTFGFASIAFVMLGSIAVRRNEPARKNTGAWQWESAEARDLPTPQTASGSSFVRQSHS